MANQFLIVGLGNPGTQYEHNRHNIGFAAVDAIAKAFHASNWSKKFLGLYSEARTGDAHLYLLKPQTYMNLSGDSVKAAAQFYKIQPEQIIVLHDELDLPVGKLRVKQAGGAGGHNGIKSIDAHIGNNYHRVRIGISHPGDRDMVSDYVLGDFSKVEREFQKKLLDAIVRHFALLLAGDDAGFMNKVAADSLIL